MFARWSLGFLGWNIIVLPSFVVLVRAPIAGVATAVHQAEDNCFLLIGRSCSSTPIFTLAINDSGFQMNVSSPSPIFSFHSRSKFERPHHRLPRAMRGVRCVD